MALAVFQFSTSRVTKARQIRFLYAERRNFRRPITKRPCCDPPGTFRALALEKAFSTCGRKLHESLPKPEINKIHSIAAFLLRDFLIGVKHLHADYKVLDNIFKRLAFVID